MEIEWRGTSQTHVSSTDDDDWGSRQMAEKSTEFRPAAAPGRPGKHSHNNHNKNLAPFPVMLCR